MAGTGQDELSQLHAAAADLPPAPRSALGRALLSRGLVSARQLNEAQARAVRHDIRLADSLRLHLSIPSQVMAEIEAELSGTGAIDPVLHPPDPRLLARLGPQQALGNHILPWRQMGRETVILTARPERFGSLAAGLTALFGPVRMAVASESRLQAAIRSLSDAPLTRSAETRSPGEMSCRAWNTGAARRISALAAGLLGALALVLPGALLTLLMGWALVTLMALTLLRGATILLALRPVPEPARDATALLRLPVVTLLVPLFREREIAAHLVRHLSALDYPTDLLDVCLLLEDDDLTTRAALEATNLPRWMRAITVPRGTIRTKPRALNFGLGFARGSLIGIYDAEDRPARDQIRKAVARFAALPERVACLQGILDYYNPRANWLARCFTLEYAAWFRLMLPGVARLGLVVPLGGTTLFFRRAALEALGGWDAHNVTEDADLGVRLARQGYRTDMLDSVTEEEANARLWPWIRQRSRWIKGYAITYAVHMRHPSRTLADLGMRRFLGLQVQFLGTLSQVVLAPLLWSFWLVPLGLPHPLAALWPDWALWTMAGLFLVTETLHLVSAGLGALRAGKAGLIPWALTLGLYYPLATLAAWKGLAELLWRPFYWDKTAHGLHLPD